MLIRKIDDWMINNVFQKFAHWTQRTFGINNFIWARMLDFVWLSIAIYQDIFSVYWLFFVCIHFLLFLIFYVHILGAECICAKENNGTRYLNPARMSDLFACCRLWMVSIVPFAVLKIFSKGLYESGDDIKYISFVLYFYFVACIPLPPCKSKIRKMTEKLAEMLKSAFAPTPAPVPIPIYGFAHQC